jgi:LPXTG-site transpeptidase (sortase) family protein
MRWRLIVLFALASLLISMHVHAAEFRDSADTPYAGAFAELSARGIVEGYKDGTGRPFQPITRVEALKVLLEAGGHRARVEFFREHSPPLPLFRDIDQRAWYAPYIEAGFALGITKGYPDALFRPAKSLSAEEAVVLLLRAFGEKVTEAKEGEEWYVPALDVARAKNLISERELLPMGYAITRGKFFDMVYRMLTIKEQRLARYPEEQTPKRQTITAPPPELRQYVSAKSFAITIPSLSIHDLTITHPSDPFTHQGILAPLRDGLGHLFSYPGMGGKILFYGHSSGYPWDVSEFTRIFRRVNELNPGDRVYVTYEGTLHVYEVTREQRIPANDTSAFSGEGEELILYTCWPPDSISERYLVFASPVTKVALQ